MIVKPRMPEIGHRTIKLTVGLIALSYAVAQEYIRGLFS